MGLIDTIKSAALKAVEASNPVNVLFGKVNSVSPLEIEIHQKLILTKEFLVLTERVTKYEVNIPLNTLIRNGLKKGDRVVLLREQGGQRFIVLDKVVDA